MQVERDMVNLFLMSESEKDTTKDETNPEKFPNFFRFLPFYVGWLTIWSSVCLFQFIVTYDL